MYKWLQEECNIIKTPKFHLVDGPVEPKFRDAVLASVVPIPTEYKELILEYGKVKLFRNDYSSYAISIFGAPRLKKFDGKDNVYQLGYARDVALYSHAEYSDNISLFIMDDDEEIIYLTGTFNQWLKELYEMTREEYSQKEWEYILTGPAPFNAVELQMLETRKQIQYSVEGIDSDGDLIIKVTNNGQSTIELYTIGARSKDRKLNGAITLKIGHIKPGTSELVHARCYKELRSPLEMELFPLPEPMPEDREYYPELEKLPGRYQLK